MAPGPAGAVSPIVSPRRDEAVRGSPPLESVSAIIVSFSDPAATLAAVDSLLAQSRAPVEILVVDNHPGALLDPAELNRGDRAGRTRLVHQGENLGYTAACNLAAAAAQGHWLFFLNPDARAEPACLAELLSAARSTVGILGAQILLPSGRTNAGANPLHVTGVAWAGRCGEQREHGPARSVASVSGAALLARATAFRAVGGMCERFFLYVDDVDLCWRVLLTGWEVVFCPEAVVEHDYAFEKGVTKWYWLERNRLWAVLSNYSARSLVLLAPVLLCAEAMILATAGRRGWLGQLLRAWASVLGSSRELLTWRRLVQSRRSVGDAAGLGLMTGRYDSPLVESPIVERVSPVIDAYRRAVLALVD